MNHGSLEFQVLTGPILDAIADEGLRIARENGWTGLVIDIVATGGRPGAGSASVRCTLRNAVDPAEVDEPSAVLLNAALRLQGLFVDAGTPLAGATIDWVPSEENAGRVRRRCSFRYD